MPGFPTCAYLLASGAYSNSKVNNSHQIAGLLLNSKSLGSDFSPNSRIRVKGLSREMQFGVQLWNEGWGSMNPESAESTCKNMSIEGLGSNFRVKFPMPTSKRRVWGLGCEIRLSQVECLTLKSGCRVWGLII